MAVDKSKSPENDLDRTDRLPVLSGTVFEEDVSDDAVQMDYSPAGSSIKSEFSRVSTVDLPSLAESVRSVEERIARQNADYEALGRSFEKARTGESVALARSEGLASENTALRSLLESEHERSRGFDKALADKEAAAEATRARAEEALRDAERYRSESAALRETLATRDAAIAQVQHSLGERDAQLNALQREHAQIVPALDERSKFATQLEADLNGARARIQTLTADLKKNSQSVTMLSAQVEAREHDSVATHREVNLLKTQAATYLEHLRTHEWRHGFDQNMFRELDAKIGAAQDDRGALQAERDQLRQRLNQTESKLSARDASIAELRAAAAEDERLRAQHDQKVRQTEAAREELQKQIASLEGERNRLNAELSSRETAIAKLKVAASADEASRAKQDLKLQQAERLGADLGTQIAALEGERTRLNKELAGREAVVVAALAAETREAERGKEAAAAADRARANLSADIARLQSEARAKDEELGVLMANLKEARRPIEPIEAEVKRLTEELAAKALLLDQINEDNRALRAALERARGALQEREFLIRRLERSESNNANVLGRIQTSIERLGSTTAAAGSASAAVECSAEMMRIDGDHKSSYTLARRTRIGRAPGCEMQIESSSVSRHHALLLMGTRDVIIEDLNSTNGVIVNGRKVSRQLLNDGDVVTIGDAQFRLSVKFASRVLDGSPPSGGAGPGGP